MDFLSPTTDHNNDVNIPDYPLSFKGVQEGNQGKVEQAFLSVKPAILLNCTFKIIPCLFFSEQFEPVVSSFSAGEISPQPALRGFVYGQTQDPTS